MIQIRRFWYEERICSAQHYAPVIDVKGQGYDNATYLLDLYECRELGVKIQAT